MFFSWLLKWIASKMIAPWMAASWIAAHRMDTIWVVMYWLWTSHIGYFADFGQVKN